MLAIEDIREAHCARDYHIRKHKDLCLDPYYMKRVIAIVSDLLDWTLSNTKTGGLRRMDLA